MRLALALLIPALALGACKGTGGDGGEAVLASNGARAAEPVLVCGVRDEQLPVLEAEVFATGFDPQRGTTVEVLVHNTRGLRKAEVALGGHGSLTQDSLEVVFDRGRLTASLQNGAYQGQLEIEDVGTRAVRCE